MSKLLPVVVSASGFSCAAARALQRSALTPHLTRPSFYVGMFCPGLCISTIPACSISSTMSAEVRPLLAPSDPRLLTDRTFSTATPSLPGSLRDSSSLADEIEDVRSQIKAVEVEIKKVARDIECTESKIQESKNNPTIDSNSEVEQLRIKKSNLMDKKIKLMDKENKLTDLRRIEGPGKFSIKF